MPDAWRVPNLEARQEWRYDGPAADSLWDFAMNVRYLAETQNMHRGYRFDVRSSLRKGSNELRITFASPVKYGTML